MLAHAGPMMRANAKQVDMVLIIDPGVGHRATVFSTPCCCDNAFCTASRRLTSVIIPVEHEAMHVATHTPITPISATNSIFEYRVSVVRNPNAASAKLHIAQAIALIGPGPRRDARLLTTGDKSVGTSKANMTLPAAAVDQPKKRFTNNGVTCY